MINNTFTAEMARQLAESEEVKIGIVPILKKMRKLIENGARAITLSRLPSELSQQQIDYLLNHGFKLQKTGNLMDGTPIWKIEW
jgi:hypothetical protein